jgi:hypothetical protein
MRAWLWAAMLIVLAAVIGVACGGGDGDGEAEPTPDRPTLEAMLTEISLKIEDLPEGWGLMDEAFLDNAQVAETDPEGPTAGLERLNGWGRLLGHVGEFLVTDTLGTLTNGGTAMIRANVSIFADEEGATEAVAWGRDLLSSGPKAQTLLTTVDDLEGGPISFPTIGDETVASEFTGKTQPEGVQITIDFDAQVVVVRNGKGVAYLIVGAIGGAQPGPEVEELIRLLNDRMAQVLG